MSTDRRTFIKGAALSGVALTVPVVGCKSGGETKGAATLDATLPPITRPADWDAVAYNKARGARGFIPDSYLPKINGPEGVEAHLGKHLPYVPKLDPAKAAPGMLAIMWGDPTLGYTRHPNAPKTDDNPEGHWYNWIRVALDGDAESQVETRYDDWPAPTEAVNGKIVAFEGDDPTADKGKNSVYLALLPEGASSGAWVRVWAHCLTHGEYVDWVQVP